jgi:hypothetical protein
MRYLRIILFVLLCCVFLSCSTKSVGKVQSELVTLTIQCEKGNQSACDRIPKKKAELESLLSD